MLNDSFLALMTNIGHQTGLPDVMAGLPPSTSEEIGRAAGLNERNGREWLGAMVSGRVVQYEPKHRSYTVPPERAASLTRRAGSRNLVTMTQFLACRGGDDTLLDRILPAIPGLGDRLTAGVAVLHVGCGAAPAVNLMARPFPNRRFIARKE